MTLKDLKKQIDIICEYYNDCSVGLDNIKVRVGIQKNYPLLTHISNICTEHRTNEDKDDVIWLAIGDGVDYTVPREIWYDSDIYESA